MRVLFSIIPGHGHFFPMLPMAHALADAGHEVTFASAASYGPVIRDHGFVAIESGPDFTQGRLKEAEGIEALEQAMFVDGPPIVARDLLAHAAEDRPDVLISDVSDRGADIAASISGVPIACVVHGPRLSAYPLGWLPLDLAERAQTARERWLDPWEVAHTVAGAEGPNLWIGERIWDHSLALVQAPPSLGPWPYADASHTAHPLRPEIHTSDADDAWRDAVPDGRPVVSVSLGTLFGTRELNEVIARGALAAGATPVVATPFEVDVDGAIVVPWVSMDHLMEASDAFVHHGGWGVTTAGMVSGTPMVVVPQGADQFENAGWLSTCGAAVPLRPEQFSEASVAAAVAKALEEPVVRLNAERLAAEVAAMPTAVDRVPLVEELARTGGPILNR